MTSMKYTLLQFGEIYQTTKEFVYSNYDDKYAQIVVPEGQQLLFRSFQPHGKNKEELCLFYWLKTKTTICLVVSSKTPILHVKHVEWENRNIISNKPAEFEEN